VSVVRATARRASAAAGAMPASEAP
jgi:hypothetical protein